ncbi:Alkaline phosphatase synthesis transcriptional regulatory protein PhoP [Thermoflexales bacterium]|nr:Alkaline phosphatase synthesis transcriptional regulatory protein PhoP [Thermoflexales bacterium]
MKKILIVDDDPDIVRLLAAALREAGYASLSAASAIEGLRALFNERPNLILLDVMMPGMDGWEMAARVRELSDVPLIMVTAKDSEVDKLRGFNLGIDDYVTKPFSLLELNARIEAVLSRAEKARQSNTQRHYVFGDLIVDLDRRQVMRGDRQIDLTPTEFRLLQCLVENANTAVSEARLRETVWGALRGIDSGYVRRYIWFLRRKLENDAAHPQLIRTVRNYGYRLEISQV